MTHRTAHEVRVFDTDDDLSRAGAHFVGDIARRSVAHQGGFTWAVSGGRTPWRMFAHLRDVDMPWADTTIYQVDERIVGPQDPDRNLGHLMAAVDGTGVTVVPMPVDAVDLDAAAATYADALPTTLDLVHLGLGSDGHTASLVPRDAILDVRDRAVALTASIYQGHRRMSLTYPYLERAGMLMWLVSGADKAAALDGLLTGDQRIPAGRIHHDAQVVFCDLAALSSARGSGH